MTNELQLARAAGLTSMAEPEIPSGSLPGGASQQKPMGLKKIHRVLRGRYPLVITLGILFGIAGAMMGYLSQHPHYGSMGTIEISPTVVSASSHMGDVLPDYSAFLLSQAQIISSHEMIRSAMDQAEWKAAGGAPSSDEAVEAFYGNLLVTPVPETNLIDIHYMDLTPQLAQAGAKSLCDAYKQFFDSMDPLRYDARLNQLNQERDTITYDIQAMQSQMLELSKGYGSADDLLNQAGADESEVNHLNQELSDAKVDYESVAADMGGLGLGPDGKPNGGAPVTAEQIGNVDLHMHDLLLQRQQYQTAVMQLKAAGYGENYYKVQDFENMLAVVNAQIQAEVDTFNHANVAGGALNGPLPQGLNLQADLAGKAAKVKLLTEQVATAEKQLTAISRLADQVRDLKTRIEHKQTDLDTLNHEYDDLYNQRKLMENQLMITSQPSLHNEPESDRRKAMAAIGFIGGGLLPAALLLIVGGLDGRFRYSDETNTDLGGVPLLGILPNLPDLLTDPSQAATAAHCVHQIRTILQITSSHIERRAFAVTSGSPGDGKTSLTLALGLSFAASGSRTLLIDGDLVGGGLTARLHVSVDHGVLEAMASRDVMQYVRPTDVTDLFFLPVGQSMGAYTGTISPAAVRRLVDEARNHFDVIVIDTGPILGSIEASPVSVAVDGVVLCVSRGQQRQLVDRALAHMKAIGARLAGVVFNRAQATDFARSVNRLSLEPLPGTNGHGRAGEQIGPVAKAVASSVRPASTTGDRHG